MLTEDYTEEKNVGSFELSELLSEIKQANKNISEIDITLNSLKRLFNENMDWFDDHIEILENKIPDNSINRKLMERLKNIWK